MDRTARTTAYSTAAQVINCQLTRLSTNTLLSIYLFLSHREIQLIILKNIVTLTSAEFNEQTLGTLLAEQQQQEQEQQTKETAEVAVAEKAKKEDGSEDSEDSEDSDDSDTLGKAGVPAPTSVRSIKSLFEPYLKSFFVKSKDSTQTKILKLEILTNLSNSANISLILREFQAYILNLQDDLEFMSATIESIGNRLAHLSIAHL